MEIPAYPAARPLNILDKPLLDQLFAELQPRVSELTFAGLYLFRHAHSYQMSLIGEALILRGSGYDGDRYCLPPLGGDVRAAFTTLLSDNWSLYGADQLFVERYLSSEQFQITEERDAFDYLYLREELATLPGSRFHKKKNRVNYFTARHTYEVCYYSGQHCQGCQELLHTRMLGSRDETNRSSRLETAAASEALQRCAELGLEGVVILVDGVVAGFALGERLNDTTAVCHFEKADPFKEGLYQLINREFARLLFPECTYINREQDLGEAGLRNAKLSYHPVELIKKYRISLRQS